jgi:hypothetical protein
MRDVAFLVRLPERTTGIQRSWHLLEGLLPEDKIRSQEKQTRKEISSAMQGNLCGEQAGVSKGHISPMPGVCPGHGEGPNLCKQGGAKRARHGNEAVRQSQFGRHLACSQPWEVFENAF